MLLCCFVCQDNAPNDSRGVCEGGQNSVDAEKPMILLGVGMVSAGFAAFCVGRFSGGHVVWSLISSSKVRGDVYAVFFRDCLVKIY